MPDKVIRKVATGDQAPIGKRYNRLTVIAFAGLTRDSAGTSKRLWKVRCDCGTEMIQCASPIQTGNTKSCGCLKREAAKARLRTHGLSGHPLYVTWAGMIQRCTNPKNYGYKWYGAKGVTVCERWRSFDLFFEDMAPTWKAGLTLERKDTTKGYEPGNVVWDTWDQQHHNRSDSHFVEHDGRSQTVTRWANELGIPPNTIYARLRNGWSPSDALSKP